MESVKYTKAPLRFASFSLPNESPHTSDKRLLEYSEAEDLVDLVLEDGRVRIYASVYPIVLDEFVIVNSGSRDSHDIPPLAYSEQTAHSSSRTG